MELTISLRSGLSSGVLLSQFPQPPEGITVPFFLHPGTLSASLFCTPPIPPSPAQLAVRAEWGTQEAGCQGVRTWWLPL